MDQVLTRREAKMVAAASAALIQQDLNADPLDELRVDLVPVLLGRGVRLFDNLDGTPLRLHGPRSSRAPAW